ncbi:hypothetical protein, partial [Bradyrhizobium sp.]|uniref:hypothetical protein n=1 Tax=Bradyrhizobium sp. TaxID=376 RepID=UPI003C5AAF04
GQMGFVELLPQPGNFNLIGIRKEYSERIANHPATPRPAAWPLPGGLNVESKDIRSESELNQG